MKSITVLSLLLFSSVAFSESGDMNLTTADGQGLRAVGTGCTLCEASRAYDGRLNPRESLDPLGVYAAQAEAQKAEGSKSRGAVD